LAWLEETNIQRQSIAAKNKLEAIEDGVLFLLEAGNKKIDSNIRTE
jgi:hypothetical protein